jgi:putative FmdB family regulatory protein
MPIYEYVCRECSHAFEHLARSMNTPERVPCPECGSGKVERQMSVFAARQGSGGGECGLMPGGTRCQQCPGAASGQCPM